MLVHAYAYAHEHILYLESWPLVQERRVLSPCWIPATSHTLWEQLLSAASRAGTIHTQHTNDNIFFTRDGS